MRETLILLPGWGLNGAVLQPLAEALGDELQVQVAELPALTSVSVPDWLDELDARLPGDCWLAGWSLGGMLAAALAARRGERCRGLIGLASNARFVSSDAWPQAMPADTYATFYEGCAHNAGATLRRFAMLCAQGSGDARGLARLLQANVLANEPSLLAGLQVLATLDNRTALATFAGPQLHLLAEQDALVPAAVADELLALLPAGEVDVLEGCGHAFVVEQPQALAGLLLEFIREASDGDA
ncbi:alpha/beta fold hydrolase [Ectopseudomonas hydrolytica]|jgi:pimeloyl-[acyl-carrier protein] methyl ester esterase|uniref:alpha/beta fold hydrolase n=1 Tax=Ectopseudomonas hydrolytica TaxID=2493633 RepID=UPI0018A749F8|nr:alpha/beta fold hydrolase [Pseudomonas hydrolytica]MBF8162175.1 alpha/beta fold hydrolase [Pseudomonas mendocina]UTH31203.1 alpha/beta fold hydrolase [Pseudomonas hydrolytica]UZZ10404.1 alpha/beta fold hydrolase [Pseudomonas mendocina]